MAIRVEPAGCFEDLVIRNFRPHQDSSFSSSASCTDDFSWQKQEKENCTASTLSVKAERPNHPSRSHARQGWWWWGAASGGGDPVVGGPPWQRRHVHDSIRPIRLTVALGLKTLASILGWQNKYVSDRHDIPWISWAKHQPKTWLSTAKSKSC